MKKAAICFLLLLRTLFSHSQSGTDTTVSLYFQKNLYTITDGHKFLLDDVLKSNRFKVKHIRGFADTMGATNYNLNLSLKRTEAVYNYLLSRNWIDSATKQEYFGEQYLSTNYPFNERKVEVGLVQINKDSEEKDSLILVNKYELSNIYFRPDQAIIESFSIDVVDDVAETLKKFPGCKFEIIGHVNYNIPGNGKANQQTLAYIQKLSEDRAKAVFDMLIERGISLADMKYKGMGNSQMIYKNPVTEEEKRKNMRVEIGIYCNKNSYP